MIIYFVILLTPIVGGLLLYRKNDAAVWFLRISLAVLFFISSFRAANMGADYPIYIENFYYVIRYGASYMERGFTLLNKLASFFTQDYWGIAIAVNLLIFVALYIYLKRNVEAAYWPLCVFVFVANPYMYIQSTFNAMRQTCALAFLLFAVDFLKNKKWLGFLVCVILAAQMHQSVYVVLVLLLFRLINWSKLSLFFAAVVALLLNLFGAHRMLNWVLDQFEYERYIDYAASLLDNWVYVFGVFVVIIFFIYHYDRFTCDDGEKFFVDLYIFSLCFLLLAVKNDVVYRVYIMFAVMSLPALPVIWKAFVPRRERRVSLIHIGYIGYYLCFYIGYFGYLYLQKNTSYFPFEFCF